MTKNDLWKSYNEMDNRFQKAKAKRALLTILFFSVLYFALFCVINKAPAENILGILGNILSAIFLGGIHFWLNSMVFSYLFRKGQEEQEALTRIEKQMLELEDCNNHTDK